MNEQQKAILAVILSAAVRRAKAQVIRDFMTGAFEGTIPDSFSELHDFVDANYYGGAFEENDVNHQLVAELTCPVLPADADALHDLAFNACIEHLYGPLQNEVDAWLRGGGLRTAMDRLGAAGGVDTYLVRALADGLPVPVLALPI